MDEIPQPTDEPYSPGDQVRIYIASDDPDKRFHGNVCEVLDIFTDDLDSETGRQLDRYSYRLQRVESNDELPVTFRHRDLVPASDSP